MDDEPDLGPLLEGLPGGDAVRLARTECVRRATRVVALAGGITNRNYRVSTPAGDFVVRLSDPESSLLSIDRENEYLNTLAAAHSGVGPPVEQYIPGAGVLVVAWVHGRTFTEQDVAEPAQLPRIADACRRLHGGPTFASDFDMFEIQQRYLAIAEERGFRIPGDYHRVGEAVPRLRNAMLALREETVPCNNDLLAANIIDDGDRLWLIDYEYSGNNEASFELGNIWSESTLPEDLLPVLVDAYWGRHDPAKVARARLWSLMSQYGWTLWAAIQAEVSPIAFDYWSWGMEKYERAARDLTSGRLDAWLDSVAVH